MATVRDPKKLSEKQRQARLGKWLQCLNELVDQVEGWAKESGWATRRLEKTMKDSDLGEFQAPSLRMQEDFAHVLLEPIAPPGPGDAGVVDLYLMPAYDDIARVYFKKGQWRLHYLFPGRKSVLTIRDADALPLTKETLVSVMNEMVEHAATSG